MPVIDLRSDTVTQPTPQMRAAMADAEVGDDVLGDDPTVLALENRTAEVLGKAAAVYMPSGTMTNQVAIRTHTEPGDEIILEAEGHSYYFESGGPAAISGVSCRLLQGRRGIFTAQDVRAALRPRNVHFPWAKLVCIENTHNRGGGTIWPIERIAEVEAVARSADLKMHLDGARLWNASVATGISPGQYAAHFDSVSVCFSKGLGAPVGSALAGGEEFIARARRFRKMLGGGMRQAGIIAAGALYALEHHRDRLADDHANAKALAQGLAALPGGNGGKGKKGLEVDAGAVETNILFARLTGMPAAELVEKLRARGVLVLAAGPDSIRAVTNLMVAAQDIPRAIEAFAAALSA